MTQNTRNSTKLSEIVSFLDATLTPETYQDLTHNSLQVDAGEENISTIGFAVDAGKSIFEKAVTLGCQLLITHHGLFWGEKIHPISGMMGEKVRLLINSRCSLYSSHLPLDGHIELGNAAQILKALNLPYESIDPFGRYRSSFVGASTRLKKSYPLSEILASLSPLGTSKESILLPFGATQIQNIAVVTGGGGFALSEAKLTGADLFISGEPSQQVYHEAKELGITALFAGHYATEVFGVQALKSHLEKKFGITGIFIDEPTGI